ncbi:hypothetical protein VTK73DRAFT_5768 [Phialemonium thermophilum]|uniref:Uncharacterized protein n=1 Tax=Phialemonium thermophilum TaxID=223376 RepID=A0ABR3V149_9PEZI
MEVSMDVYHSGHGAVNAFGRFNAVRKHVEMLPRTFAYDTDTLLPLFGGMWVCFGWFGNESPLAGHSPSSPRPYSVSLLQQRMKSTL